MTIITIYDPAMCCSTGICGAEVDQHLVTFAADLDWLKSQGVAVTRINLTQEPAKFAENGAVKTVLETTGVEGLPVIMVGDAISASGRYPARQELAKFAGVDCVADGQAAPSESAEGCCGGEARADTSATECC